MRKVHEFFIMKAIMSLVAGGLAAISLAGCGKSIELENVGRIPDLGVLSVATRGDLVYATTKRDALLIIDISAPDEPTVVGRLDGEINNLYPEASVVVSGDLAYVTNFGDLLRIVDISQPSQPVEVGQYQASSPISDIVIREPYAYLASPGLVVLDVSAPDAPVVVGEVETPSEARALALSGDYALIANLDSGLFVADISDPTAPRAVGSNPDPSGAGDIEVRGDRAYLALQSTGLAVMDISDPEATRMTDFEPVHDATHLAVGEDVAYVAKTASVVAVDVSDPDQPETAGEYEFSSNTLWITSVAVSADHLVVGRKRSILFDPLEGELVVLRRKN